MQNSKDKHIIFISGWGFKAGVWNEMAAEFKNYSTILIDLPLEANCINRLVGELSVAMPKKVFIVAWSFGGLFAIQLCKAYPKIFTQLILISSTAKFLHQGSWIGIKEKDANEFFKTLRENPTLLSKNFITLVQRPYILEEKLLPHLAVGKSNQHELLKNLDLFLQLDMRQVYQQLQLPILNIVGWRDRVLPAQSSLQLEELNKQTHTMLLKDAGHVSFLTHSKIIAHQIKAMVG